MPLLTQGQGNAASAATTPGQAPVTHPISHLHQLCPRLNKNVSCEGSLSIFQVCCLKFLHTSGPTFRLVHSPNNDSQLNTVESDDAKQVRRKVHDIHVATRLGAWTTYMSVITAAALHHTAELQN